MRSTLLYLLLMLGWFPAKAHLEVSVVDFGASPIDDEAEAAADTLAFQNAIDSLASTGGTLVVPQGVYHINAPLMVPQKTFDANCSSTGPVSQPMVLRGEGRDASILVATSTFASGPLQQESALIYLFGHSSVRDLTIHGNWDPDDARDTSCFELGTPSVNCPDVLSGVNGIKVTSSSNVVENVSFYYCRKALDVSFSKFGGAYYNQFSDIFAYFNGYGLYMETPFYDPSDCSLPSDGSLPAACDDQNTGCGSIFLTNDTAGLNFANANTITNLNVNNSHVDGIRIDGANGNTFTGGSIEGNRHGIRISDGYGNSFLGTWIEDNPYGELIQETLTTKSRGNALVPAPVSGTTLLTNLILSDHISKDELQGNVALGSDRLQLLDVPANLIPDLNNLDIRNKFYYRGKPIVVPGAGGNGPLYTWIKDFVVAAGNSGSLSPVEIIMAHPAQATLDQISVRFGVPRPDQNFQIREGSDINFTGDVTFETAKIRTINDLKSAFMDDAIFNIKNPSRFFTLKKEGVPTSQFLLQADAHQDTIHIPHLEVDHITLAANGSSDFVFQGPSSLNNVFFHDKHGNPFFRMNTNNGLSRFFKQVQFSNGLLMSQSGNMRIEDSAQSFQVLDHESGDIHLKVDTTTATVAIKEKLDLGGTVITAHHHGTASLTDTVPAQDTLQLDLTVTGAAPGDTVTLGLSGGAVTLLLSGQVTAANTVKVTLFNPTSTAIDLTGRTLNADTWRH